MSIKVIRSIFLIFVVSCLLPACVKKAEQLPLPETDLVKILADLHLAEAAFQNLTNSSKDTLAYFYYDQIYEIHGVSKAEVDSCISIMNRNPQQFFETYKKVQEHLIAGAAENLKQNREEKKK